MRFISTRTHGMLDYVMGALLIAAPWLFGFAAGAGETASAVIVGAGLILYSLFTDYELGAVRAIPMPAHLTMDVVAGAFLAVSPWLLGFAEIVWVPHLVLGLLEIGAGLMTKTVPEDERVPATATAR